ncbi:MAG: hypothetical protein HUJ85_05940 [Veillonella sp.]|nr:hypothetical protein [Veillonella sp.]
MTERKVRKPLAAGSLTEEELAREIQKGIDDAKAGRVHTPEEVDAMLKEEFNL